MNWDEYLLVCLGEELNESAQEVAKCLRFTCNDQHPSKQLTNLEGLSLEFSQAIAVIEMLAEEGIKVQIRQDVIDLKKKRLLQYAKHSRELGVLK